MLMLMLWPPSLTSGVTHVGAYHRPRDSHFYRKLKFILRVGVRQSAKLRCYRPETREGLSFRGHWKHLGCQQDTFDIENSREVWNGKHKLTPCSQQQLWVWEDMQRIPNTNRDLTDTSQTEGWKHGTSEVEIYLSNWGGKHLGQQPSRRIWNTRWLLAVLNTGVRELHHVSASRTHLKTKDGFQNPSLCIYDILEV